MTPREAFKVVDHLARDPEIDRLLVDLLRYPSVQTERLEADAELKAFIAEMVAPRVTELTGTAGRLDDMGNLIWRFGRSDETAKGLLLMGYAMTFPAASMKEPFSGAIVDGQAFGVARRKPGHFGEHVGIGRPHAQAIAAGKRQEVRHRPLDDAQAVLMQTEIAYHAGMQQAYRVRGDGIAESRVKFLRERGAAHLGGPLAQRNLQAARSEVACARERVVASADQHGIEPGGFTHCCCGGCRVRNLRILMRRSGVHRSCGLPPSC